MDLPPFVQEVRVEGGEKSARTLEKQAKATRDLGDATTESGGKAEKAGDKFGKAENGASGVGNAAGAASTSLGGLGAKFGVAAVAALAAKAAFDQINKAIERYKELLEEVNEVTRSFADSAVDISKNAKTFAGQIGVPEDVAVQMATDLQKAGGMDWDTATEMGVGAHIAFGKQGGLDVGDHFAITKELAGIAGARDIGPSAMSAVMRLLKKSGKLGTADEAKEATAKILAAADEAEADKVGEFVEQILEGGATFLQYGVSLEDVLEIGGQTREVETTGANAAQAMKDLDSVALGTEKKFTKEINRLAKQRGMNVDQLTSAERIEIARDILGGVRTQAEENYVRSLMSAERGSRVLKSFRGSNVDATSVVTKAIAEATKEDFERTVREGKATISFRAAVGEAERIRLTYEEGRSEAEWKDVEDLAKLQLKGAKRRKEYGLWQDYRYGEEASTEMLMMEEFKKRRQQLVESGADVSEVDEAIEASQMLFMSRYGYRDDELKDIARAIQDARDAHARGEGKVSVNVQNTNISTAYFDGDPSDRAIAELNHNE